MDTEAPSWMDEGFLTQALQSIDDEVEKVVKFETEVAVAAGNNFLSNVLRVNVNYLKKSDTCSFQKSIIVKYKLTSIIPQMDKVMEELQIYEKEGWFYHKIIPQYKKLFSSFSFAPKELISSREDCLVLEDLKSDGYVMASRLNQLDYEHCVIVVQELAKLHAVSVKLWELAPHLVESVGKESVFRDDRETKDLQLIWFIPQINCFMKVIQGNEGCQRFVPKIQSLTDLFWQKLVDEAATRNAFNVLNHGDLWTNNLLFKYDNSGKPSILKFVDFQVCRYGSPAIDLLYFIVTSAHEEVRININELLSKYLEVLNGTLEELRCTKRLSLEQLENDLRSKPAFVIHLLAIMLPIILSARNETLLNDVKQNKDFTMNLESNPMSKLIQEEHFQAVLPNLLNFLENKGWI